MTTDDVLAANEIPWVFAVIHRHNIGLYPKFTPRMARVYGNAGQIILDGIGQYVKDVTTRDFPQRENWFTMKDEQFEDLTQMLEGEA